MKEKTGKGYVLGRQVFIELWSLLGLDSIVCELVSDFPGCYQKLKQEEIAFVLVESEWFKGVSEFYKRKIKTGDNPIWVEMPSLKSSVKNRE